MADLIRFVASNDVRGQQNVSSPRENLEISIEGFYFYMLEYAIPFLIKQHKYQFLILKSHNTINCPKELQPQPQFYTKISFFWPRLKIVIFLPIWAENILVPEYS